VSWNQKTPVRPLPPVLTFFLLLTPRAFKWPLPFSVTTHNIACTVCGIWVSDVLMATAIKKAVSTMWHRVYWLKCIRVSDGRAAFIIRKSESLVAKTTRSENTLHYSTVLHSSKRIPTNCGACFVWSRNLVWRDHSRRWAAVPKKITINNTVLVISHDRDSVALCSRIMMFSTPVNKIKIL
jgi:hypothetical protein